MELVCLAVPCVAFSGLVQQAAYLWGSDSLRQAIECLAGFPVFRNRAFRSRVDCLQEPVEGIAFKESFNSVRD